MITSAQGGFTQNNRFAGLTTNDDSDDDTVETITGTINSHMANLMAQTAATINEHAVQTNASLQQLAANTTQLHQQQQAMMNQIALLIINNGAATQQTIPQAPHRYTSPQRYPNINKGMATSHSSSEDAAEQEDEEADKAKEEGHNVGVVEVYPRYPCHMSEAISSSNTSREVRNEDSRQLYTPTKRSTLQTKTCATLVVSTLRIGT